MTEKIGRYIIEGVIGEGGMGVVYKGFDPTIQRPVALKTIRLDNLLGKNIDDYSRKIIEIMEREAKTSGRLFHPNIVTTLDAGEWEDRPYIVLEYVEGESLLNLLTSEKGISFEMALDYGMQLCDALFYAHSMGIIHRDIKPGNILINKENQVKITDFGLARISQELQALSNTSFTVTGTINYIAPERLQGAEDHRSDLFSLGIVLYEMAVGIHPFISEDPAETLLQISSEQHTPPTSVNYSLPSRFDEIIEKMLHKDPLLRYQSANEIKEDLSAIKEKLRLDKQEKRAVRILPRERKSPKSIPVEMIKTKKLPPIVQSNYLIIAVDVEVARDIGFTILENSLSSKGFNITLVNSEEMLLRTMQKALPRAVIYELSLTTIKQFPQLQGVREQRNLHRIPFIFITQRQSLLLKLVAKNLLTHDVLITNQESYQLMSNQIFEIIESIPKDGYKPAKIDTSTVKAYNKAARVSKVDSEQESLKKVLPLVDKLILGGKYVEATKRLLNLQEEMPDNKQIDTYLETIRERLMESYCSKVLSVEKENPRVKRLLNRHKKA